MSLTYSGCNQGIPNREYLTYNFCGKKYDLQCANVSSQLYYNTADHREKWKCLTCIAKEPKKGNTDTLIRSRDVDNVTIRKTKSIRTNNSLSSDK